MYFVLLKLPLKILPHLGHLLLILCLRLEKFPMTMGWAAHYSLFINTTYTFNDLKVAVGGSIMAICHGNKVVLVL